MRFFNLAAAVAVMVILLCAAAAEDATVAAPEHYRVEFENDLVRVVRVSYRPHEKSPMHDHQGNPAVIVSLKSGGRMHFMYPDGSTSEGKREEAGTVRFMPERTPFRHAGEDAADNPIEVIRIELKTATKVKECGAR